MSEALLTGGTGFIGRHVSRHLLARGYRVLRVSSRPERGEALAGVEELQCDLLDPNAPDLLLAERRPSHWLHLAWTTEHGRFWTAPDNLDWVAASLRLLRRFAEGGGRRVVMAGTCAEYAPSASPCDERATPLAPTSLYGASKRALYETFHAYNEQAGLSGAWGRIFSPYGPGEAEGRLVPSVARALLSGESVRCTHGRQIRDWMHVEDVADAFAALLDSQVEGPVNVASGVGVPLRDVVLELARACGAPDAKLDFGALEARPDEAPVLVADTTRLEREVGWRGGRDLRTGLAQVAQYWRERLETPPRRATGA